MEPLASLFQNKEGHLSRCIFCQIVKGEAQADILYQDEQVTAFRDIQPAASVHILIIPNQHIASLNDSTGANEQEMGRLFTAARLLAEREGLTDRGYRLILNTGPDANQTVPHLHLHLLGGARMRYPMG
jgi:histidine triad (HIT) family protein